MTLSDIDKYDKTLIQALNTAIKVTVPHKIIRTNSQPYRNTLPASIIKVIKTKRRAHRLFMKQRTDDNRRLYKRLQEDVKTAINHYEAAEYHKLTDELQQNWKSNPKNYWQNINKFRGLRTYKNHPLKINDQIILYDAEKAETFRQMLQKNVPNPNEHSV